MEIKSHSSNKIPVSPSIDKVGVEERIARFQSRSIKNEAKKQGLNMVLSMIDLTTLEGKDTEGKVKQMCYKAKHLHDHFEGIPQVAAVCVYPSMVAIAKNELRNSSNFLISNSLNDSNIFLYVGVGFNLFSRCSNSFS